MTMTFFWCKFGFGKCSGASSWSNHSAGCCWLSYKIHFSLHITSWSRNGLLLHRIWEDNTSKQRFSKFLVSSWGTHSSSVFTFPICFKRQMIIEWSTLSSCAISRVVVRGSASIMALNWSLSTSDGQLPHSSSSRLSSLLQNFSNHHRTVWSLAVPGSNALLMLQVVSSALCPILNSNKKIAQIYFLSNIIFIV